jgi:FtsZ-binding cell division protein ZapB
MNKTKVDWLVKFSSQETRIAILHDEIEVLKSRYNPDHSKIDVLYLIDTISMLELRIKELEDKD